MIILDLENIKIPSINQKYILSNGRLILNSKYRNFKEFLARNCIKIKLKPSYCISITISTYKDIDNCIKLIIDSIELAGVIKNDKEILRLYVDKIPIKKGKPESITVLVIEI